MSTLFSVNVNKIALLRNSRGTGYPDLLDYVSHILGRGVRGITMHPRPDQRHIKYRDVYEVRELLSRYPDVELNIEGRPDTPFLELIADVKPTQCTFVPDSEGQLTSDHGYQLGDLEGAQLSEKVAYVKALGVRTAMFMDPVPEKMPLLKETGADRIELYTYSWNLAFGNVNEEATFAQFKGTVAAALEAGLEVNAGHDLNLRNLPRFLEVGRISEVSIGHALTVESIYSGIDPVIEQYLRICERAESSFSPA